MGSSQHASRCRGQCVEVTLTVCRERPKGKERNPPHLQGYAPVADIGKGPTRLI